jgi:oligopeptide/dipeptide ABC transporter ATP-binding protein
VDGRELLRVRDVSVSFQTDAGAMEVVDGVSFGIDPGRTMALVGESGCGKSVTASAVMRLLPQPHGVITAGQVLFQGTDLLALPLEELYAIRGSRISMIFQEPMTALNPVHTAGRQITEVFELHRAEIARRARREETLRVLREVGMPSPEARLASYPFQLSGGMRQRVMIAMALSGRPRLLIADEPTTALDVTVQAQILGLIRELQASNGMGVLYITHDMGVVAEMSDEVTVMYAGQVVESGPVRDIFSSPLHPYTVGLIGSMPRLDSRPKTRLPAIPGSVPSPRAYPATCRFAARCGLADERCRTRAPALEPVAAGPGGAASWGSPPRTVRCFKPGQAS